MHRESCCKHCRCSHLTSKSSREADKGYGAEGLVVRKIPYGDFSQEQHGTGNESNVVVDAAVHMDGLPCHVGGLGTDEETDHRGKLFRCTNAAYC